jgi:hypothetical protein
MPHPRNGLLLLVKLGVLGLLGACTDVELIPVTRPIALPVVGHFCSEDPTNLLSPVKVLFIVDTSSSMQTVDPLAKRRDAVQQVVDRYSSVEAISFAIMTFPGAAAGGETGAQICSYESVECTTTILPGHSAFTTDPEVLRRAIDATGEADGPSPFRSTLHLAGQLLTEDIALDPEQATRTHYEVIMLADGVPCPAESSDAILAEVQTIAELSARGTARPTLHTVFLDGAVSDTCGNSFTASEILDDIAAACGGRFISIQDADSIDLLRVVETDLRRPFELRFVVAENRNARLRDVPGALIIEPDSDGDGLSDREEEMLGTSPMARDTDADGCSDKLELADDTMDPWVAGFAVQPSHCYCREAMRTQDSDGDGLLDCEEIYIGTDKRRFDSDGDMLPDGLEFRAGSNPSTPTIGLYDQDEDGRPDQDEIRVHLRTDVNEDSLATPEDESYAQLFSYQYTVELESEPVDGVSCYQIRIDNISLAYAKGITSRGKNSLGENNIELTFVQLPAAGPVDDVIIRHVVLRQHLLDKRRLLPARSSIEFLPADLHRVE